MVILFGLTAEMRDTIVVEPQMQDDGVATDWAILDVPLRRAGGRIDGHDDLFTAMIAEVLRFVVDHRSWRGIERERDGAWRHGWMPYDAASNRPIVLPSTR